MVRPYVGVAPQSVRGLIAKPAWVLTIENLTTFQLAAEALKGRDDGVVVFTGGMPSPAWVAGFRRLTGDLPASTVFYHWGDIDVGGFRIAARLNEVALPVDCSLQPWLMDLTMRGQGEEVSETTGNAMRTSAVRVGWLALQALPNRTLEQERIALKLPR